MNISLICADGDTWALGLRSISSTLKAAGCETRLVFTPATEKALSPKNLKEIKELTGNSDLIGISSMSNGSYQAKRIIEALSPHQVPIVWGGMHPTLFPEDCVGHADLICRGEGEQFMLDLAERLKHGRAWKDVKNAGYLNNGAIILNDIGTLIEDLDRLPKYDFTFMNEYRFEGDRFVLFNEPSKISGPIYFSGSRGCGYHCTYCSNSKLKDLYKNCGHFVRRMSISAMLEGMAECKNIMPKARRFYITEEDLFARRLSEIEYFSDQYPKTVGLPFECMASPLQITEEKLALLVKAGLWRIGMGVESGSDRTKKKIYNRVMPNKKVLETASIINKHREVVPLYFLIIGNPYEEKEDLLETLKLARNLPDPFFLRIYNLIFIPGTILFEKAVKDRIIQGIEDSGHELDFLAGFNFKGHSWKRKNMYLNTLIFAMTGKSTHHRLGILPRILIQFLIHPKVINFHDKHQALTELYIEIIKLALKVRGIGAQVVKSFLKNPLAIYRVK
ncbi:MAG: radical SAM protein [Syntrophomonas sp.]